MIENKENYIFNAEENSVVKNFVVLKDGKQVAGGFVCISDNELMEIYETDPDLAMKDSRMESLLNNQQ